MTDRTDRSFVVMAKPVGSRCSMRCSYCYYLDKGKYSSHEKQFLMDDSVLETLIRETIALSGGPVVSFIWHGGEPTLAGIRFYEKVVELERKYLPPDMEVWNNLQTNGYALNDEWFAFLKMNGFDVGVSIDGTEAVHDFNRRTASGKPTWERVRNNILRMRSFGIEPDLLCTVNSESLTDPVGVYRALRELGTGWIQFIPIVVPEGEGFSPESVDPQGYGRFLSAVFDEWVRNDLGRCDVQLFSEYARIKAGGPPSLCWMSETCGRALIAEEDGGIYACDHFVDSAHRRGTLGKELLSDMLDSPEQLSFGNAKRDRLPFACTKCEWKRFCNGGCPKDRFIKDEGEDCGRYYLCEGLKDFFAHADPVLTQVMKLSASGRSPDDIMKHIRKHWPL